jgi:hypothetical protein
LYYLKLNSTKTPGVIRHVWVTALER